jgi:hypothetical protein
MSARPLRSDGMGGDNYLAVLEVRNLTSNATVAITVNNGYGTMTKYFSVVFVPAALGPPPPTPDDRISESGIAAWLIALVAIACVLFILVLTFTVCAAKSFCDKRKSDEQQGRMGSSCPNHI